MVTDAAYISAQAAPAVVFTSPATNAVVEPTWSLDGPAQVELRFGAPISLAAVSE